MFYGIKSFFVVFGSLEWVGAPKISITDLILCCLLEQVWALNLVIDTCLHILTLTCLAMMQFTLFLCAPIFLSYTERRRFSLLGIVGKLNVIQYSKCLTEESLFFCLFVFLFLELSQASRISDILEAAWVISFPYLWRHVEYGTDITGKGWIKQWVVFTQ